MIDEQYLISKALYEASGKSTDADFYEADTITSPELTAARTRIAELEAALQGALSSYDYLRTQLKQYDLIVGQSETVKQARAALKGQE